MSLEDRIRVNAHYTRSVNLERDADSKAVVSAYIPTSRALQTLSRIAQTTHAGAAPRAWALVGPYGSGKSSFAVFLSHLLGYPFDEVTAGACRVLQQADADIGKGLAKHIHKTQGYCRVLLTGSPEPLTKRFMVALSQAASAFWANRRGRAPAIVGDLAKAAERDVTPISEAVERVARLQSAVARAGGKGVLVVIDELGKFLEYEARHYGASDIYLLQALAEHAQAGHEANLIIAVLLHQSFEQYAKGLGDTLRNEWVKVQGRYESVPFLESTEQTLRVVAAAFKHTLTDAELGRVRRVSDKAAKVFAQHRALPGALTEEAASELFTQCYPIHPVTLLLLPTLCQKVAQNERTLFSYLGSHEPHGLKDSMGRLEQVGDWVGPWDIYDYFIQNQPAAVTDPHTHRRWAEVVTALERLADAPAHEIELLKTVGLLNIVGAHGGFKASKEIVRLSLSNRAQATKAARALTEKSLVTHRKYSAEYRVWQGSDFDLEAAVEEARGQIGRIELAESLNARKPMLPIVARKYSVKTGALRYFQPEFVDAQSYRKHEPLATVPRILFYLAEGQDDVGLFREQVTVHFSSLDIVTLTLNGDQFREAVTEVLALEKVQRDRQELNADPVAKRELLDRLAAAQLAEDELLQTLTDSPEGSEWYWSGEQLQLLSKRDLQHELSRVLEAVYYAAPVVKNELINRDKPSSQAHAARNKLLFALLNHEAQEDLGIDKYPAEKGIYRALLRASGLHRKTKDGWCLTPPDATDDPYHFSPVWSRIDHFLANTEEAPKPFTSLDEELTAPPYGVKAGVLPILYVTAYLVYQHEVALYENRAYTPYLREEHIERFLRHPHTFTVQRFPISGLRASIFRQYAKVLYGDTDRAQSVLSVAKPLARFIAELPEYTQRTKRLSNRALQVRTAFQLAKSPQKLLFDILPESCGYTHLDPDKTREEDLEGFAGALTESLKELKHAYPNLLTEQQRLLAQAFHAKQELSLSELRTILRGRCNGLQSYTVDVEGLRAFINRVNNTADNDQGWLTSLLLFLGRKPVEKWADSDRDQAEFRLTEFARRLNDLEKLRVHYEGEKMKRGGAFDVILLRAVRRGGPERDEVICLDAMLSEAISDTKKELMSLLEELGDRDLRLAVLAELTEEVLTTRQGQRVHDANMLTKKEAVHE